MGNTEKTNAKRKWDYKERVVGILQKRRRRAEVKRSAWALAGKIVVIALCGYLALSYLFAIGIVNGEGMYPRLRDGDMVIFYRLEAEQNVNDIVAYSKNGALYYGRIVALGGDSVDLNEDGQLIVNGSVQQEEVFSATSAEGRATVFPVQLAADEVFVLGDNREYAQDSRDFGPVTRAEIAGKVLSLLRNRGL
jgi:signal peptidase I